MRYWEPKGGPNSENYPYIPPNCLYSIAGMCVCVYDRIRYDVARYDKIWYNLHFSRIEWNMI